MKVELLITTSKDMSLCPQLNTACKNLALSFGLKYKTLVTKPEQP